jgi:hypothetical protein
MDSLEREVKKFERPFCQLKETETPVVRIRFKEPVNIDGLAEKLDGKFHLYWFSPTEREILFYGVRPEIAIAASAIETGETELTCKVYAVSTKLQLGSVFIFRQNVEMRKIGDPFTEEIDPGTFYLKDGTELQITIDEEFKNFPY